MQYLQFSKSWVAVCALFCLTFLSSNIVKAQDAADPNAPVISVDGSDTYDFGQMKQGDVVTHVFTFKNTGKSNLIITDVTASCGCTTPDWPKEAVKPGGSSKITVKFNSEGKSGSFNKAVTITSNTATKRIFIKGIINLPGDTGKK